MSTKPRKPSAHPIAASQAHRKGEFSELVVGEADLMPIILCKECGTPQLMVEGQDQFHCLACGHNAGTAIPPGSWMYSYLEAVRQMTAPLVGAMLMIRRDLERTPILLKVATEAVGVSYITRFRVTRARRALEDMRRIQGIRMRQQEERQGHEPDSIDRKRGPRA